MSLCPICHHVPYTAGTCGCKCHPDQGRICPHCNGTGRIETRTEPMGICKNCGKPVYNYNLNSYNRRRCVHGRVIHEKDQLRAFAGAISCCICCKNLFGHFGEDTICGFCLSNEVVNEKR